MSHLNGIMRIFQLFKRAIKNLIHIFQSVLGLPNGQLDGMMPEDTIQFGYRQSGFAQGVLGKDRVSC